MKISLFTITLLLVSFCVHAQSFLNSTKKHVSHFMQLHTHVKCEIIVTDSTITYQINDANYKKCDVIYHFDKLGKCDSEASIYQCEECYNERLKSILTSKWTEASDTRYVAKKMQLEIHYQGQPYAFIIKRTRI